MHRSCVSCTMKMSCTGHAATGFDCPAFLFPLCRLPSRGPSAVAGLPQDGGGRVPFQAVAGACQPDGGWQTAQGPLAPVAGGPGGAMPCRLMVPLNCARPFTHCRSFGGGGSWLIITVGVVSPVGEGRWYRPLGLIPCFF